MDADWEPDDAVFGSADCDEAVAELAARDYVVGYAFVVEEGGLGGWRGGEGDYAAFGDLVQDCGACERDVRCVWESGARCVVRVMAWLLALFLVEAGVED